MNEEYNLEPIIEYCMNEEQTLAYKLGLMWMSFARKVFPNCKAITSYPKKGDPRNSVLFRYCYKLQRETKTLIDSKDYKLYIMAQLQMLKAVEINNAHPLIVPACLIGPKAWVRWKMWKKKFEHVEKAKTLKEVGLDKADITKAKKELDQTKKFLTYKIKDEESFTEIKKDIERWVYVNKISGFYAVLSPWFKKHCILKDLDITYYSDNITPELQEYFIKLFPGEHG